MAGTIHIASTAKQTLLGSTVPQTVPSGLIPRGLAVAQRLQALSEAWIRCKISLLAETLQSLHKAPEKA